MDDRKFDEITALDWIRMVETGNTRTRPGDIYPRLNDWIEYSSSSQTLGQILEIGAGQGICSDHIDLTHRTYTGVEPSPYLVDRAKKLYSSGNRTFLQGDVYSLPFSASAFHAAFSVLVWHLLGDVNQAAFELSRVLKKNGHFLIITANPDAYPAWMGFYAEYKITGRRFEGDLKLQDGSTSKDVLYLHTLDEIKKSLQSAGLTVSACDVFRDSYLIAIQGQKAN